MNKNIELLYNIVLILIDNNILWVYLNICQRGQMLCQMFLPQYIFLKFIFKKKEYGLQH